MSWDWDAMEKQGRERAGKQRERADIENAKRWPARADDPDAPLLGVYQGERRIPSMDGSGSYAVILIKDRSGELWRVNKNAGIRRGFEDQGQPRVGDALYIQVVGKGEFEKNGELIRFDRMSVTVFMSESDAPPSATQDRRSKYPAGTKFSVGAGKSPVEQPDDDLMF